MASRGTPEWMAQHYGGGWPTCTAPLVTVRIFGKDRAVHRDAKRAFLRLDRVFRENAPRYYKKLCEEADNGTVSCRPIAGTQRPSNHSFGTAIDLDWQENGFGKDPFDCPIWTEAKEAVKQIENEGPEGRPLFRWGGRYGTPDAMHFEVMLTPQEIRDRIDKEGKLKRG